MGVDSVQKVEIGEWWQEIGGWWLRRIAMRRHNHPLQCIATF